MKEAVQEENIKVGDQIIEISSGDEGVVTELHGNLIYANWITGFCTGNFSLPAKCVILKKADQKFDSVESAIKFLTDAGYTVTLSKKA